jgi:hypothetical protein
MAMRRGASPLPTCCGGQQMIQVASPPCWVFFGALAACLRAVQHSLNATAQPGCRFRLVRQMGSRDQQDRTSINICDRHANQSSAIAREGQLGGAPPPSKLPQRIPDRPSPAGTATRATWVERASSCYPGLRRRGTCYGTAVPCKSPNPRGLLKNRRTRLPNSMPGSST